MAIRICFVPSLLALAACGVETASTAATAATMKKQELEQGRETLQRAEDKINAATAKMQERAAAASGEQ
ncbi:MAG TPA: hypothetical protein VK043_13125 [Burkholderiales bacterium]|nr:hypothetical protein [Burkholderiales bacterium]